MSETTRNIFLGLVGAIIGASVAVWGGYAVSGIAANAQTAQPTPNDAKSSQPQVTISGGDNVVSVGQMGGITARIVTINPPMNPELRILGRAQTDNPDGSHTVTIRTEVASPITPGLLIIQIGAQGLKDVSIMPPPVNGVSSIDLRNKRMGGDFYSAEIPSPRGQYDISVQTMRPTEIHLNATF